MMKKDSRIYIAGHSGLIGSAFARQLQAQGFCNIVTRTHGQLNLTDKQKVTEFFKLEKPEYVVLCAGKVGGIVENKSFPADFIRENLAIQQNVIEAAHTSDIKRLIFFGSSCMYPRECPQPMAEGALFSGVPEPTSMAYAVAKMAGTQMCLAYNQQYGEKRFIPVIPNSAYGPNDNFNPDAGHVLSALIRRFHEAKLSGLDVVTLWGSGSPRREFVHSDDIADACIKLLTSDIIDLDLPVNLGSGSDVSIKELADTIAGVIGFSGRTEWDKTKPDGAPRKLLDSSRIQAFGWSPKVAFKEGLTNVYQWYVQETVGK
jgi:GDP-L-fucose synthase